MMKSKADTFDLLMSETQSQSNILFLNRSLTV